MAKELNIVDNITKKISIDKLRKVILEYWGGIPFSFYTTNKEGLNNKIIPGDYSSFINFLKENSFFVNIICSKENKYRKLLLSKLLKVFKLNKINFGEIFEYIISNGNYSLTKKSDWETLEKPIFSNKTKYDKVIYHSICFKQTNNFGHEIQEIIFWVYSYYSKIIWVDAAMHHYSKFNPKYFIDQNNKIYGLDEEYQKLIIYSDFSNSYNEFSYDNMDDIIIKYKEDYSNFNRTEINIGVYFYKGFFQRGHDYDENWRNKLSVIKNICFDNNLLKIEIENQTHPHSGFIWLNLENKQIVKSEIKRS